MRYLDETLSRFLNPSDDFREKKKMALDLVKLKLEVIVSMKKK